MERLICSLIGYLCGSFLTAEVVVRHSLGKRPEEIGTGNPGMANVMAEVGKKEGFLVLAGDIIKTMLACFLSYALFFKAIGRISIFYAGIGALIGHNYPVWNRFRGGKGVTVTCTFSILYAPILGVFSSLCGAAVVLVSGYLSIGGIVIPALYVLSMLVFGTLEAKVLAFISLACMVLKHRKEAAKVFHGKGEQVLLFRKKA